MPYAFVSYSEADDIGGDDIKNFVERIHLHVHRKFGKPPKFMIGRSTEDGLLNDTLKDNIRKASLFIPIFSDNYARRESTAWSEMVYARSLLKDDTDRNKGFIKPVLYRAPTDATGAWTEIIESSIDCFDLTESWIASRWQDAVFEAELERLAGQIGKALFGPFPAQDLSKEVVKNRADVLRVLKDLQDIVDSSPSDNVFLDELRYNIIEEVREEIVSASNPDYRQDLSLGRCFIVRAKAIFRPARSVVAVSLDSSSDFWTGENTRKLALEYTRLQPKNTVRLFVFSSPQSMLMHRWVLDEHYRRYGSGVGKVLFTSLSRWQAYLNRPRIKDLADRPSLSEDFGILNYAPGKKHVVARLSASELSFKEVPASQFMSQFSEHVQGEVVERPHPDGETFAIVLDEDERPTFWRWRDVYGTKSGDAAWLRCVADVFDGDIDFGPSYKAAVMHNVFFNPTPDRRGPDGGANEHAEFERFIKGIIFDLLGLVSGNDQLVKSIWFGRYANELDVAANDPIHQNRLTLDPSIWKYCLSMTFSDQAALKEFYEHREHAEIRKKVYKFLDPNVGPLYEAAERKGGDDFGDAIERIIRKYLLRMDYVIPDPYFIYRAVAAPPFADALN